MWVWGGVCGCGASFVWSKWVVCVVVPLHPVSVPVFVCQLVCLTLTHSLPLTLSLSLIFTLTLTHCYHSQGAAEGREPLLQRGRYCVAVKRSRRSAVSKGSVKLGESGTGVMGV